MSRPKIRVLSLGCCDGGIEVWLAEQLAGEIDLHVDGVDMDRRMIASAAQRAAARELPGEWKLGAAEDAPDLFDPGTYDLVVAFELIEHVADVDVFLARCEQMLAPGGRVYVSTPNGTFGTGGNPHHLRVFTATDLADTLRRRGHLQDMVAGADGVACASYQPAERRGEVAIFTGPGWERWSPMDILTRGLGGSETAAVRLAEQLDALGYVVTVYGDVEETCYRSVLFRRWETFDPLEPRQAVICSRQPQIFDRPIAARSRILWLHDTDCGAELTPSRAERIDHVAVLSDWHEAHVRGRYPFAAEKVTRVRNGVLRSLFTPLPLEQREQRCLYTSSPDRGLDVLLELWPQVREQVPGATLEFCYAQVYQRIAEQSPQLAEFRARIAELAQQDGVRQLDALPQPALAKLMCASRVWAHPSWASMQGMPFHETSCIGAMEAQAAGCHVVASRWGALPETVRRGYLIEGGGPDDERWRSALVDGIVAGLAREDVAQAAIDGGPAAAADLGWDGVARLFEPLVEDPVER